MVTAKVIEIRPNRYVLKNSLRCYWSPSLNGHWWCDQYKEHAKVWWTKSKAERQLKILEAAGELS